MSDDERTTEETGDLDPRGAVARVLHGGDLLAAVLDGADTEIVRTPLTCETA